MVLSAVLMLAMILVAFIQYIDLYLKMRQRLVSIAG